MKNQKGITMTSLTIFILSFVIIIGIISSIAVFFTSNTKEISMSSGASSDYNKFNLYMLNYTKNYTKNGYKISKIYGENEGERYSNGGKSQYVTFSNGQESNTFVKLGNILYFNEIKLCENVDEFKVQRVTADNGKDVLKTYLQIGGTVYTTDYVIE